LTPQSSTKIYILSATICIIIFWNYWIPTYLYSPTALRYGTGFPDFNIFYSAGYSWLSHSKPANFIYPPTSLPFYGFFALFNLELAGQLWRVTYLITFLIALASLALTFERVRRVYFISLTGVLFFTSYPLLIMMNLGQVDLLVASLSVISLAMQRLKRENASAVLLSAATLMKGPPILLLVYFVLYRRDLRYLLRFVLASLLMVIVSLSVVPLQLYADYLGTIAPKVSAYVSSDNMNQSLLSHIPWTGHSEVVTLVGILIFSLFTVLVTSKKLGHSESPLRDDAMFLLNVLAILLLSPRIWPGTYVWVILPVGLFLSNLLMGNVRLWYLTAVCFDAFLLNANLTQIFLLFSHTYEILPLAIFGNIMLTAILTLTLLRPSSIDKCLGKI
jgi:hypothetical protein